MDEQLKHAIEIRNIYYRGCEFSEWVINPAIWKTHRFSDTIAFYHKEDSLEDIKKLALYREPCNITMRRLYDTNTLQDTFGWKYGAYSEKGMPNFAIFCNATVYTPEKGFFNVQVLNLIGCALDSNKQPDISRYNNRESVIQFYKSMWKLALEALKYLKKKKFHIYNVGGGAFSGVYGNNFIKEIFEPAFLPLLPEFISEGIDVIGYDIKNKKFTGGIIPDCLNDSTQDLENTVYVNAWDPWSLIGNGNEMDNSLDGAWGRCSNMSILGWLKTNPMMQFVGV